MSFIFKYLTLPALFFSLLSSKMGSSWDDLKTKPSDTNITLTENSTLTLSPSATNALFSGNVALNGFSLDIDVKIASVTGQANQTTIFQNTSNTPISIAGNGSTLNLTISSNSTNYPIKSVFNADGGVINISSNLNTTINNKLNLFSLFRSANGGKIVFTGNLNIDLTNTTASLQHNGIYYKSIFDIVNASVEINQDSTKNISLIGDIYSNSGVLRVNFTSATSKFEGKMILRGDEFKNGTNYKPFETTLSFSNTASGNMQIKTQGVGTLSLSATTLANIQGSIDTQDLGSTLNTTALKLDFDNSTYTASTTLGGSSSLNANFKNSSSWSGNLTLKTSTQMPSTPTYTLNFEGSSFGGDIIAEGNNNLKATFNSGSINSSITASNSTLDLTLNNLIKTKAPSVLNITATNTQLTLMAQASTYSSDLILNGSSISNLAYSASNITSNITVSDTSSLTLALTNSSTLSGTLSVSGNSPTLSLSADRSTCSFTQATIGGAGTSSITLENSSQWLGNLEINSPTPQTGSVSPHTIALESDSHFEGALNLQNSTNLSLSSSQSSIEGNINISNSAIITALLTTSTLKGDITLQERGSLSLEAQNKSIINSLVNISDLSTQTTLTLNNSQFIGAILQPNTNLGNLTLSNSSTWHITQSSTLNSLTLGSNDIIDFTQNLDGTSRTLTAINDTNRIILQTQSISGSGSFHLYGTLEGGNPATDRISTTSLTGTHTIKLYWNPSQLTQDLAQANFYNRHIVVAEQNSTEQKGEFVGGNSIVGVLQYDTKLSKVEKLDAQGTLVGYEWILGTDSPVQPPSPPSPPISSTPSLSFPAKLINTFLSSQYKILSIQLENLHARLGDLRNLSSNTSIWTKSYYSFLLGKDTSTFIDSKFNAFMLSFGADYNFYTPLGRNFLGGVISLGYAWDKAEDRFQGNSSILGYGIYDTFLFHNGIYIDSTLRAFHSWNTYTSVELGNQDFSYYGLIASVEIGKKFRLPIPTNLNDFYYLKPEFSLSLSYLPSIQKTFIHPTYIPYQTTLHSALPFDARLQLDFGKRFEGENLLGDLFLSFGAEYTLNAKGEITLQTDINQVNLKGENLFNLKAGIGGNILINQTFRIYLDLSSKFLGYLQPLINANLGLRITLGSSNPTYTPPYSTPSTLYSPPFLLD